LGPHRPLRFVPDRAEVGESHGNGALKVGDRESQRGKHTPPGPLANPRGHAVRDIAAALNLLLADLFALYLKTKNFHWHVSGPHFPDYHRLFDAQAGQILAATDALAGRVRKLGAATLRSVGHIARLQRVVDNDADELTPPEMLTELRDDNVQLVERIRDAHALCDEHGDIASAGLLQTWSDEAEQRAWFLAEAGRGGNSGEPASLA
jgi:starvation-inducible DNA-binding protein